MTNERLRRVLNSATSRLAADGADAYRLSMEIAWGIINSAHGGSEEHVGDGYVLWMEISDLVDAPDGPQSHALCRQVAESAAAAWDSIDQSNPERVSDYFSRWSPRGGNDWLSAQNLS